MRVVIVGSGAAGMRAALAARAAGLETVLATKGELLESTTACAQGGIAAAIGRADSAEAHAADTLAAGAGVNNADSVDALCHRAAAVVDDLKGWGMPFDRDASGAISLGLEAAHSAARIVHAGGDATGAHLARTLADRVRESGATILEHAFLRDLVRSSTRVVGVELGDAIIEADAVVIATGGAAELFAHSTNPSFSTGDGLAAAIRAGAAVSNLEFYQFHPTTLAAPGHFLISEAVRGEGAVLLDETGHRFMLDEHPLAELAPRDVVARAMVGRSVVLDATALGAAFLARRFPTIDRAVRRAGHDWSVAPIPVTPAAHYFMGGIDTDAFGRSSLRGLFAVGEVANAGVHGANRLASNSLLEALVFGERVISAMGADAPAHVTPIAQAQPAPVSHAAPRAVDRSTLQSLMWNNAGLSRTSHGLRAVAQYLDALPERAQQPTNHERENANLALVARELVRAAESRTSSLGAHFRDDDPLVSHPHHALQESAQ